MPRRPRWVLIGIRMSYPRWAQKLVGSIRSTKKKLRKMNKSQITGIVAKLEDTPNFDSVHIFQTEEGKIHVAIGARAEGGRTTREYTLVLAVEEKEVEFNEAWKVDSKDQKAEKHMDKVEDDEFKHGEEKNVSQDEDGETSS